MSICVRYVAVELYTTRRAVTRRYRPGSSRVSILTEPCGRGKPGQGGKRVNHGGERTYREQDLASVARDIIDSNAYMTLATADENGRPWASPVWYAHFYWVSSPEARHSRNLAARSEVGVVIFDSQAPVDTGQECTCRQSPRSLRAPNSTWASVSSLADLRHMERAGGHGRTQHRRPAAACIARPHLSTMYWTIRIVGRW
jgi:Pyridoxamine 5'-phosphate oxidase